METEQVVWPIRDAPPLAELIKYLCPTCKWEVPAKHVGINLYEGRGRTIRQTLVMSCEHCDARHVLPMILEPRDPSRISDLAWAYAAVPYVCVYTSFAAIFKFERDKNRGGPITF